MPTFPITVGATPVTGCTKPNSAGPYSTAAAVRYLVVHNSVLGIDIVSVFKSTDTGVTWAEMDSGNAPLMSGGFPNAFSSCIDGATIYAIYLDDSNVLTIAAFDTATDTWGAPNSSGETIEGNPQYISVVNRSSDVVVSMNTGTQTVATVASYILFDKIGETWSGFTLFSVPTVGDSNITTYYPIFSFKAGTFTHVFFQLEVSDAPTHDSQLYHQSLSDTNTLGTLQVIPDSVFLAQEINPTTAFGAVLSGANVVIGFAVEPHTDDQNTFINSASNAADLTFGTTLSVDSGGVAGVNALNDSTIFLVGDNIYLVWSLLDVGSGESFEFFFSLSSNGGTSFETSISLGTVTSSGLFLNAPGIDGAETDTGWAFAFFGTVFYWEQALITPVPVAAKVTAGGGTYFPRFLNKTLIALQLSHHYPPLSWMLDFPNPFDICLSREWRLYNSIDPRAMGCARKPDCFIDDKGLSPWVDASPGAITFNPDKAIPLPDPATIDAIVLSFHVPIGYDGIILAQYNCYRGGGVFVEGSGDIVWRVRVNGRYLRDMGNIQFTLGSPQQLSPCPGGLWVMSGNLVEYVVSAPNGSGSLPLPGQGNILAGLHGWFFPRV